MLLVLDSNIVFRDWRLEGADSTAILDAAMKLGYEVVLPEVVVDEVINKRANEAADATQRMKSEAYKLKSLGVVLEPTIPPAEELLKANETYIALLDQVFPANRRLPYPTASHASIAERARARIRPFEKGDKGYRDTLIWLSLLEVLRQGNEPVVFVTNDNGFYESSTGNALHPHLVQDLQNLGIPPERVIPWRSLDEFRSNYVMPQLESLEDIKTAIQDGKLPALSDLDDRVSTFLNDTLLAEEVGVGELYLDVDGYGADLAWFNEAVLEQVIDVRRLPGGDVFASTVWGVNVDIEVTLAPYEWESKEVTGIEISSDFKIASGTVIGLY